MRDKDYYLVCGWMINKGLKGNELLVFAVVHSFSKDGEHEFAGSAQYLAEATGASRRTVMTSLSNLVDNGFIRKREYVSNGVKFCKYSSTIFSPYEETSHGDMKEFPFTYEEIAHNNNSYIKDDNKDNSLHKIHVKNMNVNPSPSESEFTQADDEVVESESVDAPAGDDISRKGRINYNAVMEMYNAICVSLPKAEKMTPGRQKAIKARYAEGYTDDTFREVFEKAQASAFLRGANDRNWHADFDWLLNSNNAAKVLEGKYANKKSEPVNQTSWDPNGPSVQIVNGERWHNGRKLQ